MTDDEVIANQAREIQELKVQIEQATEIKHSIMMMLVGIGGPLNDNKLGFTTAQFPLFHAIEQEICKL